MSYRPADDKCRVILSPHCHTFWRGIRRCHKGGDNFSRITGNTSPSNIHSNYMEIVVVVGLQRSYFQLPKQL